jgi:hypothetical protein
MVAEFQIRAWQVEARHIQVLVHSSPAGDIRKPLTVACDPRQLEAARAVFRPGWYVESDIERTLAEMGRGLAELLLPRPVYALLLSSLQGLAPGAMLRLRLCLDAALVDLPWEFLYRPDVEPTASVTGFLLFDHRISLVREAPASGRAPVALAGRQRILYAGARWFDEGGVRDQWGVQAEYQKLAESLAGVGDFLEFEFVPMEGDIERALSQPAVIFHYSGHTDVDKSAGYLVREVRLAQGRTESVGQLYSFELANLLQRAETRLAVFSACNSGRWEFVEPLLRAGLPALIGTQGELTVQGAQIFCEALYARLAVGLSLDEALTAARFQLLNKGGFHGRASVEWGSFMAYMPATEAVLLPRPPEQAGVAASQELVRRSSQEAIAEVSGRIGPAPETGAAINLSDLRRAIVRSFSLDEEALLCADIRQALADDGVDLMLDLDALGGREQGEEALVLALIEYLNRRGYLSYLVEAVRRERPGSV